MTVEQTTRKFLLLPGYAQSIISAKMDEFTVTLINLSKQQISHLPGNPTIDENRLSQETEASAFHMLNHFQNGQMEEYVQSCLERSTSNGRQTIEKYDNGVEHILSINGAKQSALFSFLKFYEVGDQDLRDLSCEISDFFVEFNKRCVEHLYSRPGHLPDMNETKMLREKVIRLQDSNAKLSEFSRIASHDLKVPLRKIGSFASLLEWSEQGTISEAGQLYLQKIQRAIEGMSSLIEGLLDYSVVEGREERKYCNLQSLLDASIESIELLLREKEGQIFSDGLPMASVVPYQMEQLFQNLLINALKFCKPTEKPVIRVSHSISNAEGADNAANRTLSIRVADNCLGFSPEHGDKIFSPFYRAHDKSKFEGSGLGLAICKRIVENHSGSISVTSTINEGSTFIIDIPLN